MDYTRLATHPAPALALALAMLSALAAALRVLWKRLGEKDREIERLHELHRDLCLAVLPLAALGKLHLGRPEAPSAAAAPDTQPGDDPPGRGRGPDPKRPRGLGELSQ